MHRGGGQQGGGQRTVTGTCSQTTLRTQRVTVQGSGFGASQGVGHVDFFYRTGAGLGSELIQVVFRTDPEFAVTSRRTLFSLKCCNMRVAPPNLLARPNCTGHWLTASISANPFFSMPFLMARHIWRG